MEWTRIKKKNPRIRRIVEELIEPRKNRHEKLKTSLRKLTGAIETLSLVKRKRPEIRFCFFTNQYAALIDALTRPYIPDIPDLFPPEMIVS